MSGWIVTLICVGGWMLLSTLLIPMAMEMSLRYHDEWGRSSLTFEELMVLTLRGVMIRLKEIPMVVEGD